MLKKALFKGPVTVSHRLWSTLKYLNNYLDYHAVWGRSLIALVNFCDLAITG